MNSHDSGTPAYPVSLNLKGRNCLVVGGGKVACRKVETLLEFGPESVKVVSPAACAELHNMVGTGRVSFSQRHYRPDDLDGVFVVIVATDDNATNQQVSEDAHSRGVLANVADNAGLSDFILPAYFRRGDLIVAVSTSGRSPALARKLKERLAGEMGESYAELVELASRVRQELKASGQRVTAEVWNRALDIDHLLGLLKEGKSVEAEAWLKRNLTESTNL